LALEPLWFFRLERDGRVHRKAHYRGTSLIKHSATLGSYSSPIPRITHTHQHPHRWHSPISDESEQRKVRASGSEQTRVRENTRVRESEQKRIRANESEQVQRPPIRVKAQPTRVRAYPRESELAHSSSDRIEEGFQSENFLAMILCSSPHECFTITNAGHAV
jgi:hypothetical protein